MPSLMAVEESSFNLVSALPLPGVCLCTLSLLVVHCNMALFLAVVAFLGLLARLLSIGVEWVKSFAVAI